MTDRLFETTEPLKHIIVVGDLILDRYISGTATRLSPEAPVPIVRVENDDDYRLGGAGNVAANIAALGHSVSLIAPARGTHVTSRIRPLLTQRGIDFHLPMGRTETPIKARIVANQMQLARLDWEGSSVGYVPQQNEVEAIMLRAVTARCTSQDVGAIVVSDYAKGAITAELMQALDALAGERDIPLFLDPKPSQAYCYHNLKHIYMMTPNVAEASSFTGCAPSNLEDAGYGMLAQFNAEYVVITRGAEGMMLFGYGLIHTFPAKKVDVFDVSGAGDTAIATLAVATARDWNAAIAVDAAIAAAARVIGTHGTTVVDRKFEELR